MLFESPYILGIFGLVFFYETLNVVLNFQRIGLLKDAATSMAGFTAAMFMQRLIMHSWGLLLSFFGLKYLMQRFEVRKCIMMVPVVVSMLLLCFLISDSPTMVMYAFIGLGTINNSLSVPLREALYIPATKNMKFKAKAWIDSFGNKFSKGFGSLFASVTSFLPLGTTALTSVYVGFFSLLMLMWFVTSWLLGKKYEAAIKNNEIIGNE